MALDAMFGCLKYLMFAFNFIFWLLGCSILGVGIWVVIDPDFKTYLENAHGFSHYLYTLAYVLVVVGALVMFIGFVGCCGAMRESQCMLTLFFISLFIVFVALLSAGIWSIVSKDYLKQLMTKTLIDNIKNYETNGDSQKFMDTIQRKFRCCGANSGAADYKLYAARSPPNSCQLRHYSMPCDERFYQHLTDNIALIAGVTIAIGAIMLLGMLFSLLLCCAIRESAVYA